MLKVIFYELSISGFHFSVILRTKSKVLAAHLLGMPAGRATEQGVKIWPVLRRNCALNPSSKYVGKKLPNLFSIHAEMDG
ncbi:hypothetical protein C1H46_027730 [Malus baccata]|uniref:Uncharacterized protein n=1 Tax=Malus baccata TaxID=106549 RepID=A0A540LJQ9_MALBA|nr:hypothetical protein C1H46_027730 [Malus baccata]